jgi:hypothetical protein
MRDDEIEHRRRLAAVHRLMELAEANGQAERLAQLDKLEVREFERYHRKIEMRRAEVDDASFRRAQLVMGKGRARAASAADLAARAQRTIPEERREKLAERNAARLEEAIPARAQEKREKRAEQGGQAGAAERPKQQRAPKVEPRTSASDQAVTTRRSGKKPRPPARSPRSGSDAGSGGGRNPRSL